MSTTVIIPAAGSGKRFGNPIPKQFLLLGEIPILARTLTVFEQTPEVDSVVLAVHSDFIEKTWEIIREFSIEKVSEIVAGGSERQFSILNALQTSSAQSSDIILVHDAVRPFIFPEFVAKIINSAEEFGAVAPGIPVKDTIKVLSQKFFAEKTLERDNLRAIQTPQGFQRELLTKSYEKALENKFVGTDDASVAEFAGFSVKIIEGLEQNFKITSPMDFALAEVLLHSNLTEKS